MEKITPPLYLLHRLLFLSSKRSVLIYLNLIKGNQAHCPHHSSHLATPHPFLPLHTESINPEVHIKPWLLGGWETWKEVLVFSIGCQAIGCLYCLRHWLQQILKFWILPKNAWYWIQDLIQAKHVFFQYVVLPLIPTAVYNIPHLIPTCAQATHVHFITYTVPNQDYIDTAGSKQPHCHYSNHNKHCGKKRDTCSHGNTSPHWSHNLPITHWQTAH